MKKINKPIKRIMLKSLLNSIIFLFLFSCRGNVFNRDLGIKGKIIKDSLNLCEIKKREALEMIKRENFVLYRNLDDYLHAQEYFLNKYDIILLPETKNNQCIQIIMDSVIYRKFGKDIVLKAKKEISELYKTVPVNQYSNGTYSYAEKLPEYPGGFDSLYCEIYRSISNYRVCNINGEFGNEVIVNFIIDKEGSVKDPRIVKKLCPQVNEEIIVALNTLKNWSPAVLENKRVPFLMTLSIDWNQEDIQICEDSL